MITPRILGVSAPAAAAFSAALVLVPQSARAQCNYPFMASGSPTYFSNGQTWTPTVNQVANFWSVVALRPDAGSDWDLAAYSTAVLFPDCVTGIYATSVSAGSAVDFVIGDFNHNTAAPFYIRPYLFSGSGGALVEWDDGNDTMSPNAPRIERTTGPNDVVEVWDTFLLAGTQYSWRIENVGASAMQMYVFRNPASAPYWGNRGSELFRQDLPPNSTTSLGTMVPQTDWYGVVMVNENGGSGTYRIWLQTCVPPGALTSGTSTLSGEPGNHYTIQQSASAFTAIGTRSNDPATQWVLEVGEGTNEEPPACYSNFLAQSYEQGKASYVVGDFNSGANPTGGFYDVWAYPPTGSGSSAGRVEWDDGPDSIVVNAPAVAGSTDANDVLTCWNVALLAGNRYQVEFVRTGAAKLKLAMFDNPGAGYWVPRSSASVESDTTFYFDATRTDWYGLVLANDNALAGTWQIAVKRCSPVVNSAPISYLVTTPNGDDGRFRLLIPKSSWAGMMLLPLKPTENWTLDLFADRIGAPPLCLSNFRKTSALAAGKADVIAGHPNFQGTGPEFFARAAPVGLVTDNALFQWEQGTEDLVVGASGISQAVGAGDNLRCWDIGLFAGTTYDFALAKTGGATPRLLLFRPTAQDADGVWRSRVDAEFDVAAGTSYVAPASGIYGAVVVNDNGATGSYQLAVSVHGAVGIDPMEASPVTRLERIVPHPVTNDGRIHYTLASAGDVSFEIVNAAGRRVAEIAVGPREAGRWSVDWTGRDADGRTLASGVYFVRMKVGGLRVSDARLVQLP